MATRLTPLGILLKWFVAPIALGAVGYFLVGPRVESQVPKDLKEKVLEATGNGKSQTTAANDKPVDDDKPVRSFTEPEVDVSVSALNSPPKKQRKKRRRRKPVTQPTAPATPAPEAPAGGGDSEPPPTAPSGGTGA